MQMCKTRIIQQQLWGYKVEEKNIWGYANKDMEYRWYRQSAHIWRSGINEGSNYWRYTLFI
jgi:hypothetical protein